ncbi:glycosyltransferase [Sphingobium sp. CR28]|uniref:glycosyltransferase n=1 Tax=Sphingobium sp. CR28 TaxID=3400272 RepID=UPI003FEDC6D9
MANFPGNLDELLNLDDERFLTASYLLLFNRQPDPAGLHHHLALLKAGRTKREIFLGLTSSPEAKVNGYPALRIAVEAWTKNGVVWPRALRQIGRKISESKASIARRLSGGARSSISPSGEPQVGNVRRVSFVEGPGVARKKGGVPALWLDLTTSLEWQGGVVGIVRAEIEFATRLKVLHPNLRYSMQIGSGFAEISSKELDWLLSAENPADAYMNFFGRYPGRSPAGSISVPVPDTNELFFPYVDGDVIVSVGWMNSKKEYYFEQVKDKVSLKLCYLIYDAILVLDSTRHLYDFSHSQKFHRYLEWAHRNCDFLFYGGETARRDIEALQKHGEWPARPGKVLKFGTDIFQTKSSVADADLLAEIGVELPFIMTVGSIEPRKNHETLYRAYLMAMEMAGEAQLPQLLFCGRPNAEVTDFLDTLARDPRAAGRIIRCSPSDEQLAALYRHCSFTLLPSVYEGWSLTLPESLGQGKFCIAADTPPLREIGEGMADFVPPFDVKQWADKIVHYATNKPALARAENDVRSNWRTIHWSDTAREMVAALELILAPDWQQDADKAGAPASKVSEPIIWMDLTLSYLDWGGNVTGVVRAELSFAKYLKKIAPNTRYFACRNGYLFRIEESNLEWLFSSDDITNSFRFFLDFWQKREGKGEGNRDPFLGLDGPDPFHEAYIRRFPDGSIIFFAGIDFGVYDEDGIPQLSRNQVVENYCDADLNITKSQLIYDLTPELFPHLHKPETVSGYRPFLDFVSNRFDHIVYGGRTAMRDGLSLQKKLAWESPLSTFVEFGTDIYQASSLPSLDEDMKLLAKFELSEPYALMVGTYEPRKNHEVIYRAFLMMLDQGMLEHDFKIVFAGHRGWKSDDIFNQMRRDARVAGKLLLISPGDNELDALYRQSRFTLLPSFYEGWSLTLPEALSYGKLCLAADVDPLREAGGDFVEYIHPLDSAAWARRMAHYANNDADVRAKERMVEEKWHARTWLESSQMLVNELRKGHEALSVKRSRGADIRSGCD